MYGRHFILPFELMDYLKKKKARFCRNCSLEDMVSVGQVRAVGGDRVGRVGSRLSRARALLGSGKP